jgi:hypothetical protein
MTIKHCILPSSKIIANRARYLIDRLKLGLQSKDTRLIFSINSGRCGSAYLAKLLNTCSNTTAVHESPPFMTHGIVDLVDQYPYSQSFYDRYFKVCCIKKELRGLNFPKVYCDTSQMFIKTFYDVALDAFPSQIEVIILRRYLPLVLKSYLELRYFQPQCSASRWMASPNGATAAAIPIDKDANLDEEDLIIATLIDIEARAQRFKQNHPDVKVYDLRIESLNSAEPVLSFLSKLELRPSNETNTIISSGKINTRSSIKQLNSSSVDLGYCKERINRYLQRAAEIGISVPCTLALTPFE